MGLKAAGVAAEAFSPGEAKDAGEKADGNKGKYET